MNTMENTSADKYRMDLNYCAYYKIRKGNKKQIKIVQRLEFSTTMILFRQQCRNNLSFLVTSELSEKYQSAIFAGTKCHVVQTPYYHQIIQVYGLCFGLTSLILWSVLFLPQDQHCLDMEIMIWNMRKPCFWSLLKKWLHHKGCLIYSGESLNILSCMQSELLEIFKNGLYSSSKLISWYMCPCSCINIEFIPMCF